MLTQTLADVWPHARHDSQWQHRLGLYLDLKWLHSMLTSGCSSPPSQIYLSLQFSSCPTSLSLPYLYPILSHCSGLYCWWAMHWVGSLVSFPCLLSMVVGRASGCPQVFVLTKVFKRNKSLAKVRPRNGRIVIQQRVIPSHGWTATTTN